MAIQASQDLNNSVIEQLVKILRKGHEFFNDNAVESRRVPSAPDTTKFTALVSGNSNLYFNHTLHIGYAKFPVLFACLVTIGSAIPNSIQKQGINTMLSDIKDALNLTEDVVIDPIHNNVTLKFTNDKYITFHRTYASGWGSFGLTIWDSKGRYSINL